MKVWLVERSGVEDSYVVGVFSTKEKAAKFRDEQEDPHMYSVDFWDVE